MGNLRIQRFGWYMVDWANSAFVTTVVTVFLGPYLTSVAEQAAVNGTVHVLGIPLHPGSVFAYSVSLSVLLQVLVLPLIGTLTDRTEFKRSILVATSMAGAAATMLMFSISTNSGNFLAGALLFIIANVAFGASVVVSNAFLPILSAPADRDKVSSRGWALGYLGGGLLLLAQLLWFNNAEALGADTGFVVRGILASSGIWWALFMVVPWITLPRSVPVPERIRQTPFRQFIVTLRDMRLYPVTLTFFIAYLFYNDTIQTVIQMASVYGQEELHLGLDVLTQAILLVQFVAIPGSLLFERLARFIGTRNAILVGLAGWAAVLTAAYGVVNNATGFYILASAIAIVLGGTQALSRSLFSTMIPAGKEAEYFALYEIGDKGTSWIGPLLFGIMLNLTGSYRASVFSLIILLIVGIILFLRVKQSPLHPSSENL